MHPSPHPASPRAFPAHPRTTTLISTLISSHPDCAQHLTTYSLSLQHLSLPKSILSCPFLRQETTGPYLQSPKLLPWPQTLLPYLSNLRVYPPKSTKHTSKDFRRWDCRDEPGVVVLSELTVYRKKQMSTKPAPKQGKKASAAGTQSVG